MPQHAPRRAGEELLGDSSYRVWKAVLRELKTGLAAWNQQFLPSDGRRIFLDEIQDRMLTLTSRTSAVVATMSVDGKEIALVARHNLDIGHSLRDSVQVDVNQCRHIELRHRGTKLSPAELAYVLVERAAKPFAQEVA